MATHPEPFTTEFDEAEPDNTMSDDELVSILSGYEQNTIGNYDDEIAKEQETAINYYYRRMPDLPAAPGTSQVVDGTVAIVIDSALASILKPFVSSDETVSFAPRGPEDVEFAEQATDYCNFVFNTDNNGFQILHHWFKDALLTKVGVVKCWWEESETFERNQLVVDNEIALAQARMDPSYADEEMQPDGTVLVDFHTIRKTGRVRVENVPPEEWEISKFSRSVADAEYMAHVPKNATRSDLIEMGFDPEIVETLPAAGLSTHKAGAESARENARWRDENGASPYQLGSPHESAELVDIRDEYARIDFDGDGISELRRIIRSGDTILFNEEVSEVPFAVLCPIPMPHKVIGLSLADQVIDLQRISTAIWRQTLDNLYKTNNPRPIVGEGAERQDGSTQDSVSDNAPGAEILVRDVSQFRFDSVPFFAKESFGMLEYVEGQQEARTGISRSGQAIDPNALKGGMTATEASIINQGRTARAEMIARIFAETGVRDLFKLMLKQITRYQDAPRIIRLRNKFVEVNPQDWPEFDVTVSVGLGMGDKMERMAAAQAILEDYAQLAGTPFADLFDKTKVYNALRMKLQAADIKNVDDFYNEPDPNAQTQEQPQPDPEMVKVQMEQQRKQQESQFNAELRMFETEQKLLLEAMKAEGQLDVAVYKAQMEAALAERKAAFEARLKVNLPDNRPGGSLSE